MNKKILNALNNISEKYIEEAAPTNSSKAKKLPLFKWAVLAACAFLAISGIFAVSRIYKSNNEAFPLSNASFNVKVKYTNHPKSESMEYDLVWLSEEEIFTEWDTVIFKGTVQEIRNIEIDFNGDEAYRAIAKITVEKVYRGDISAGDTLSILVPCTFRGNIYVSESEVISNLAIGMTGIFMPVEYSETSFWSQNGATLVLSDIAEYGFPDGLRWAFLETAIGLVYDRNGAFESISKSAASLEDIEAYILHMLEITSE